jgi:DNA-directed RNA polymerase specialized sigma24 family protein
MADSIAETLKEITPRIRAELNKLGYSAHVPESDDLLQETIIRLWKALENRDGKLEFLNSYVKKVVFSVYINEVNRIRREKQFVASAGGQGFCGQETARGRSDPPGLVGGAVMASLSALSETKRHIIRLHIEGFTLSEIAISNHWSFSKVRDNYYRGIEELRRRLARKGLLE